MNMRAPHARRGDSLTSAISLGEKLFSTASERRFADKLEQGLRAVEAGLMREMTFADSLADVTSRYLLDAGGKRVRPTLTLLTAQLGMGNTPQVIIAAQAMELTHLASLYHDDVMDEAELRRGVPSAQSVFGNSVAILTGDLLFARAGSLVAGLGSAAIGLQARTFERLCLGQLHETIGPKSGEDPIEHYLRVLADKTGSLIAAAAEAGVVYSDAPEEYRQPMLTFGEKIGVAFQLIDDVIDLSGEAGETGKAPGTDLRSGVATLPLLYLRRLAPTDSAAADLVNRIDTEVDTAGLGGEEALTEAIAELRRHEVTHETLAEAHRWAREAVEALDILPAGPVKKALIRFADTIVERSK